jgi:predicted dienelactone hydrolase
MPSNGRKRWAVCAQQEEGVVRALAFVCILILGIGTCESQENVLPQPTGSYDVGTAYLAFVDKTRPELFTEDPDDHREVTVRAWYPGASVEGGRSAPYYENAAEIVTRFSYPAELTSLSANSEIDTPVSGQLDKYPVVLFNHGWGEHAAQNTVLMEELASHGYVVFSLAHHYEAKYWVYPDGSVRYLSLASSRFQHIMGEQNKPGIMEMFHAMFTTKGAAAQESLFMRTVAAMPTFLGEGPRIWAEDISFVIGELDSLNRSEGRFGGRLDLEKLGVMGMSLGGAAAGQACLRDDRIIAGMNIDGGLLGGLPDTVVTQPMFYMGSRRFIDYDEVFAAHAAGDAYTLTVGDADHYDFTDFTLLHRHHPMIGSVDGLRMLRILNDYTLAFFDFYLKERDSDLLSGEHRPFAEVDYRVHRRP